MGKKCGFSHWYGLGREIIFNARPQHPLTLSQFGLQCQNCRNLVFNRTIKFWRRQGDIVVMVAKRAIGVRDRQKEKQILFMKPIKYLLQNFFQDTNMEHIESSIPLSIICQSKSVCKSIFPHYFFCYIGFLDLRHFSKFEDVNEISVITCSDHILTWCYPLLIDEIN